MDTQTKVLLTGFEPFGQLTENPSQVIAEALSRGEWTGAEMHHLILPVEFDAAREKIAEFYRDEWLPNIVLHLGVASGRETITLERFAVNMMDTANRDNAGYSPDEVPVVADAPLAYQTTIPCKRIIQHLHDNGIEAKLSNSAGTYVCNAVLFTSLHLLNGSSITLPHPAKKVQCGFIHLPLFEKVDKKQQMTTIKTILQWLIGNQQQAFLECPSLGNVQ